MGDLTRQSLRDSPDVVVIGETRGPEMIHVLDALTNGISGVMGLVIAGSETSVEDRSCAGGRVRLRGQRDWKDRTPDCL